MAVLQRFFSHIQVQCMCLQVSQLHYWKCCLPCDDLHQMLLLIVSIAPMVFSNGRRLAINFWSWLLLIQRCLLSRYSTLLQPFMFQGQVPSWAEDEFPMDFVRFWRFAWCCYLDVLFLLLSLIVMVCCYCAGGETQHHCYLQRWLIRLAVCGSSCHSPWPEYGRWNRCSDLRMCVTMWSNCIHPLMDHDLIACDGQGRTLRQIMSFWVTWLFQRLAHSLH